MGVARISITIIKIPIIIIYIFLIQFEAQIEYSPRYAHDH